MSLSDVVLEEGELGIVGGELGVGFSGSGGGEGVEKGPCSKKTNQHRGKRGWATGMAGFGILSVHTLGCGKRGGVGGF